MATKVAISTGDWSSASTWNSVVDRYSTTTNTSITGSYVVSNTFTAADTSNNITGVVIPFSSIGTANLTVALQFDSTGGGSWSDVTSETFDMTDASGNAKNVLVKFSTPYLPTSTGANRHRFRIIRNSGGTVNIYAASGSTWAYLVTYAATGVPASSDDVMILGNKNSALTVTIDGAVTIGSNAGNKVGSNNPQGAMTKQYAVLVDNYGKLSASRTATTSITVNGCIYRGSSNAVVDFGTEASPIPSSYTCTITFTSSTADNNGFGEAVTIPADNGSFTFRGASLTYPKSAYVSGAGTTASNLVTADTTGWAVNDFLCITTTDGTYNHNEYRYIKTISGANITTSTTAGGAEAGLTYTHNTNAVILNLTRNVKVNCDSTTKIWSWHNQTTNTNRWFRWAQLTNLGSSSSYCFGLATGYVSPNNGQWGQFTGVTFDNVRYHAFYMADPNDFNMDECYFVNSLAVASNRGFFYGSSGSANKTITNCYFVDCYQYGVEVGGSNFNMSGGMITGCNVGNSSSQGGLDMLSLTGAQLTGVNIHTNRVCGIYSSGAANTTISNSYLGTIGTNTIDHKVASNSFASAVYDSCTFGSATLISNYLNLTTGAEIAYQNMDSNTSKHRWYTKTGSWWSSGTGLTDTTVRTASSLALVGKPENSTTGLSWVFKIPAAPTSTINILGYIYRNATFSSGDIKAELFLPGTLLSATPDATYTFPTTTGSWLPFALDAYYSGSVARYAQVRISAKTATAGAYLFVDDLYDAGTGNKVAGLDLWDAGKPSEIMVVTDFSSAVPVVADATRVAVWADDDTYTAGQKGKDLADTMSNTDVTQAKVDQL